MGYVHRCSQCGKVIEENDRSKFMMALDQHFRDNHPKVNSSGYGKHEFG